MYCSTCGHFGSNHSCSGGGVATVGTAAPAAPAPAATAPAAPVAPAATSAAGWYPDPADAAQWRWWDGGQWSTHVAPNGVRGPGGGGASEHGALLAAIPRTLTSDGRFDVLVFERSLVLARVPGRDPARLGLLAGTVSVGWLLGYILGDYIGASGDSARVAALSTRSPESVAHDHPQNRIVPRSSVRHAELRTSGSAGGKVLLELVDGTTVSHRWTRPHTGNVDAAGVLGRWLGHGVAARRVPPWRTIAIVGAHILIPALMLLSAIAVPVFLGAQDRATFRQATDQVAVSCGPFVELSNRLSQGVVPTLDELALTVDPMVEPFAAAAQIHDDFRVPAADVVTLSSLVHSEGTPEQLGQIGPVASSVYTACMW